MRYFCRLSIILFVFSAHLLCAAEYSADSLKTCRKAFLFQSDEFAGANSIKIYIDSDPIPCGYQAELNVAVCDDKLCANVILKIFWDFAGNYVRFDTIAGKPLTKFDHKRFSNADYKKLDQILKDRNSMLRVLEKSDLVDKSIKLKATTVDAVSGATPATIKNAVVEGAVYSSYTLWRFVNGPVKDSIRAYTLRVYTEDIARQIFSSPNFETQLFVIKQLKTDDYSTHFDQICQVIRHGVPLIKAYLIGKIPLPFNNQELNKKIVKLFPELDGYSKSVFIDRITGEKQLAIIFLPLMRTQLEILDQRQLERYLLAYQKFEIPGYKELLKKSIDKTSGY